MAYEAEKKAKLKADFHEICYEKHIFKEIQSLVHKAKETYKDDLQSKRLRLKDLLDLENYKYENEYKRMVEERIDSDIKQRQQSLITIKNQKINETKEFIRQKKAQQIIENSDMIRTALSRNLLKETKICQLTQMEENKQKLLREQEQECLWIEAQKKLAASDAERELFEHNLRRILSLEAVEQNRQLYEARPRNQKEEISVYNNGFGVLIHDREEPSKEAQNARKLQLRNLQLAELNKCAQLRCKLQEGIKAAERKFIDIINFQTAVELKRMEDAKKMQRASISDYLDHVEAMKRDIKKYQKEENEIIEMQQKKLECQELQKLIKIKEAKVIKSRINAKELLEQIDRNEGKRINDIVMEREQFMADKELMRREHTKTLQVEEERKANVQKYRCELIKQIEYGKTVEACSKQKEQEDFKKYIEFEENKDILASKIVSEDDQFLMAHPNWRLIRGCQSDC